MTYDIVLITRNRRPILEVSLPLMLGQGLPPSRLIIVDASDDHASIVRTVDGVLSNAAAGVALTLIKSTPGTALQRNIGLGHVRSAVVIFPDDDALWYPGYAESIVKIYARDRDGLIGGVTGEEADAPPPAASAQARLPSSLTFRDRLVLFSKRLRRLDLFTFMRNPIYQEGNEKTAGKPIPGWLAEEGAEPAGPMSGFAMSFRAPSIIAKGFDESLGRYALFEDYDASLGIMERQLIVKAGKARVFHNKWPQKRTSGLEWGVITVLNRAFIVCKHSSRGSPAHRNLLPYSTYQCLRYLAQTNTSYGRQRFKGALRALRHVRPLLASSPESLVANFVGARESCLGYPAGRAG